jgi:hypothetical protein
VKEKGEGKKKEEGVSIRENEEVVKGKDEGKGFFLYIFFF